DPMMGISGPPNAPRPVVLPSGEHALSCWRMAQPAHGDLTYATVGFQLDAEWFDDQWWWVTDDGGQLLGSAQPHGGAACAVVSLRCDRAVGRRWQALLRAGNHPGPVAPGEFSAPNGESLVTLTL